MIFAVASVLLLGVGSASAKGFSGNFPKVPKPNMAAAKVTEARLFSNVRKLDGTDHSDDGDHSDICDGRCDNDSDCGGGWCANPEVSTSPRRQLFFDCGKKGYCVDGIGNCWKECPELYETAAMGVFDNDPRFFTEQDFTCSLLESLQSSCAEYCKDDEYALEQWQAYRTMACDFPEGVCSLGEEVPSAALCSDGPCAEMIVEYMLTDSLVEEMGLPYDEAYELAWAHMDVTYATTCSGCVFDDEGDEEPNFCEIEDCGRSYVSFIEGIILYGDDDVAWDFCSEASAADCAQMVFDVPCTCNNFQDPTQWCGEAACWDIMWGYMRYQCWDDEAEAMRECTEDELYAMMASSGCGP